MMKHCYSNLFYNENLFKIKNSPCAVNYNEEIQKLSNNSEIFFQN